jgi:histidinol phosphatase-like enzyme
VACKPSLGVILQALSDLKIDKARSFLIGDNEGDIDAARRAGIKGFLFCAISSLCTSMNVWLRLGRVQFERSTSCGVSDAIFAAWSVL